MADDLQGLLERIQSEGLQKANDERAKLLAAAQTEAAQIKADAEKAAKSMLEKAKQEAEMQVSKGREALSQAARDTLLSLRAQLQARLATVVRAETAKALAPERLAAILSEVAQAYLASGGAATDMQVSPAAAKELEAGFLGSLSADLQKSATLAPVPGITAGFKLALRGTDIIYDFTDAALADALCQFLNPKLAELLKQETAG